MVIVMARSPLLLGLLVLGVCLLLRAADGFPGPDCHNVGCVGDLTCPPGTSFTPNATLGGCCPGCVTYLGLGDTCSSSEPPECQPGLECISKKCEITQEAYRKCQSYPFYKFDYDWSPKCDPDGTYAPVQCKGERITGRCFCYSKEGARIFGQEWWNRAENMTCACSRRVEELRATGRMDITVHCTEDGNFEALQCDDGVCWCAEPRYGDALGEVVPAAMMKMLPCYNKTTQGDSYLKQCDSALSALNQIRDEMRKHGTLGDAFLAKRCGLDGSYAPWQYEGGIRYCVWRDNGKIGSYMASSETPINTINCHCARDTRYFAQEGHGFTLQCGPFGSYQQVQHFESEPACVDPDGFPYTMADVVGPSVTCDPLP